MSVDVSLVNPNVGLEDQLTQLQTYLALATAHLIGSAHVINQDTVLTDLTAIESAFGGYAAQTITAWNGPYIDAAGNVYMLSPRLNFVASGAGPAGQVYGGWIQTAGGILESTFLLAPTPPKTMSLATDSLAFVVKYTYPNLGIVTLEL
jgi:hypothetical protein